MLLESVCDAFRPRLGKDKANVGSCDGLKSVRRIIAERKVTFRCFGVFSEVKFGAMEVL